MRFYADGEGGFQTAAARVRGARSAYRLAREFGRGRAYALWLAARYLVTGRTGRYRMGRYRRAQ